MTGQQKKTLTFSSVGRLMTEHLGLHKYQSSAKALAELVSNGFDADATVVDVTLLRTDFDLVHTVVVRDNGIGMPWEILEGRFGWVGVRQAAERRGRLGQFGVGRFAAYRLGAHSTWVTTAKTDTGDIMELTFDLNEHHPTETDVVMQQALPGTPTGTTVTIVGLRLDVERLTDKHLSWDLFSEFGSYLLADDRLAITLDGTRLDPWDRVVSKDFEILSEEEAGVAGGATIEHLLLKAPVKSSRTPEQLILTSKRVAVERIVLEDPPHPHYLGFVGSPYLDTALAENRAAFLNMDPSVVTFRERVKARVEAFGERFRQQESDDYIIRARRKPYYPYHAAPVTAVAAVEQQVYDQVLVTLNARINVESMSPRHQELVFRLLHRSLWDRDLLTVLESVASLGPEDMATFRNVLSQTTLQAVLRMASEVADRMAFLDVLRDVVYGENSKRVKERLELHKIVEGNCWLFGPQFHLAQSDKKFRTIVRGLRQKAKLPSVPDDDALESKTYDLIPDLFLAARVYTHSGVSELSTRNLLVEIKRPSKKVDATVMYQGDKYANVISSSPELANASAEWDVYLVSAAIDDTIVTTKRRAGKGQVGLHEGVATARVWAYTWGELIDRADQDMRRVRQHLELKSRELATKSYLDKFHPGVFGPGDDATAG